MSKPKSRISQSEVDYVGKLANLPLTKKQLEVLQSQLDSVLDYVSQIQSLDLSNTTETSQVTNLTNIFREDKVEKGRVLTQKQALSNAKNTHNGYFMVPYILK